MMFYRPLSTVIADIAKTQLIQLNNWMDGIGRKMKLGTDFDGPSWIQYDLFRKTTGVQKRKSGQVYASSMSWPDVRISCYFIFFNKQQALTIMMHNREIFLIELF